MYTLLAVVVYLEGIFRKEIFYFRTKINYIISYRIVSYRITSHRITSHYIIVSYHIIHVSVPRLSNENRRLKRAVVRTV
jgi:hypothetical protein